MHEAQVTITASLWKEILWDRTKNYTVWKYLKMYMIIFVIITSGILAVYLFNKDKSLLQLIYVSMGIWFILFCYRILKIFLTIRSIRDDHSFTVKLNEQGVEISNNFTPWKHYKFYVEHDNYLEIHDIEDSLSYLPKTIDMNEIIFFTKKHITCKDDN